MATEFLMPKLGLTMEEGTILQWLVAEGGDIEPGTPVLLIETDKVESEVEASGSGRLHRIGEEGATFACGAIVGLLLAEGEAAPAAAPDRQPAAPFAAAQSAADGGAGHSPAPTSTTARNDSPTGIRGRRRFVSPNARRIAAERNIDLTIVRGTGPNGRIVSEDLDHVAARPALIPTSGQAPSAPSTTAPAAAAQRSALRSPAQTLQPATVAARQLADLLGIDLTAVPPDPVDGYVTREAVARHVRARLQPAPLAAPPSQTPTTIRRLSGMRGTIAKRMHSSLQEMAQLTLTMEAGMDAVVADRKARGSAGRAPSYTDYVIASVARALHDHPSLNAQVTADGIALLPEIHVGLAVALDEGLVVPVVRNADRLLLTELAPRTAQLAEAARAGTLTLDDLDGGTFSVSALGMFGVDAFTPVINPPNVAILGVGRIRDDLSLVEGAVCIRKRMTLSLTWDHRVLDGAPAAAFCKSIVDLLADPSRLG